jgi:hypothetical protein
VYKEVNVITNFSASDICMLTSHSFSLSIPKYDRNVNFGNLLYFRIYNSVIFHPQQSKMGSYCKSNVIVLSCPFWLIRPHFLYPSVSSRSLLPLPYHVKVYQFVIVPLYFCSAFYFSTFLLFYRSDTSQPLVTLVTRSVNILFSSDFGVIC